MNDLGPLVPDPSPRAPWLASLAGYGQRFLGRMLDGVVFLAPILLWGFLLKDPARSAADSRMLLYLLTLSFSFLNDVVLTVLTGRSIGKMITGTRVVLAQDHQPITIGPALIRWFVIVVLSVIPFGGFIDAVFIFSGELRQTLHDRAAGTLVFRVSV